MKKEKSFKRIDVRLLKYIIVFSTVITFFVTCIQLFFEYRYDISAIEERFTTINDSYKKSVNHALWSLDKKQLTILLEGIKQLSDIVYTEVVIDKSKNYVGVGQKVDSNFIRRDYPLVYERNNQTYFLGKLVVIATKNRVYKQLLRLFLVILATNFIKTFIVALFIMYLFESQFVSSLRIISEDMKKFEEGENCENQFYLNRSKSDNNSYDEIDIVADAYSSMKTKIQSHITEYEDENLKLENMVKAKTLEINESLEDNQRLLQILSHDISTPLMIVDTCIRKLKKKYKEEDEEDKSSYVRLDRAFGSIREMLTRVKKLQAMDTGKLEVTLEKVDLFKVVSDVCNMFEPRVEEKGIEIQIVNKCENNECMIVAEESSLINQVMNNLLSNALKFTEKNSSVFIMLRNEGNEIKLDITDQGIGIPTDLIKNIFDSHAKTSRDGIDGEKGTGFGLPLAKKFVESYGAKISVSSVDRDLDSENHGTTFSILFKKFTES